MGRGKPKKPRSKKGRKPTLIAELVAAALAELKGNVAAVAKRFEVDRTSVRDFIERTPVLQRVLADAREGMLDAAENSLYTAVEEGQAWAVCFFLKTQGKARGYLERGETQPAPAQQQAGSIPIEYAVEFAEFLAAKRLRDMDAASVPVVPQDGAAEQGV